MALNAKPLNRPEGRPAWLRLPAWPYILLVVLSLGCVWLFWQMGAGNGLIAVIQLTILVGYIALAWKQPVWAYSLLVTVAVVSETQNHIGQYDPLDEIEFSLHASFNTTVGGPPITPLELLMIVLVVMTLVRWAVASDTLAKPSHRLGALRWQYAGLGVMLLWGYAWGVVIKHGDFNKGLWEVRALSYMLLFYWLGGLIFKDDQDWRIFFKCAMFGIGFIGLKVVWRWLFFMGANFGAINDLSFEHENALFYNNFFVFGLAANLLRAKKDKSNPDSKTPPVWGKGWWRLYCCLVPFPIFAAMLQQRRGGFGSFSIGLLVVLIVGLKLHPRRIITFLLLVVIVATPYYIVFQKDTTTLLGQPVRAIQSIIGGESARDASSNEYREIEYYNLTTTIGTSPILGIGFGQEFLFVKPLPDLSWWPFWHYTPHNEVLWVWLKIGLIGFIIFWALFAHAILRGLYLIWFKANLFWRPPLIVACAAIGMQGFYAWLDQGFSRPRNLIWLGAMLALLGFWTDKTKLQANSNPDTTTSEVVSLPTNKSKNEYDHSSRNQPAA